MLFKRYPVVLWLSMAIAIPVRKIAVYGLPANLARQRGGEVLVGAGDGHGNECPATGTAGGAAGAEGVDHEGGGGLAEEVHKLHTRAIGGYVHTLETIHEVDESEELGIEPSNEDLSAFPPDAVVPTTDQQLTASAFAAALTADQGADGLIDLTFLGNGAATPAPPANVAVADASDVAAVRGNPMGFLQSMAEKFRQSFRWIKTSKGWKWVQEKGSKITEAIKKAWTWFKNLFSGKKAPAASGDSSAINSGTATPEEGSALWGMKPKSVPNVEPNVEASNAGAPDAGAPDAATDAGKAGKGLMDYIPSIFMASPAAPAQEAAAGENAAAGQQKAATPNGENVGKGFMDYIPSIVLTSPTPPAGEVTAGGTPATQQLTVLMAGTAPEIPTPPIPASPVSTSPPKPQLDGRYMPAIHKLGGCDLAINHVSPPKTVEQILENDQKEVLLRDNPAEERAYNDAWVEWEKTQPEPPWVKDSMYMYRFPMGRRPRYQPDQFTLEDETWFERYFLDWGQYQTRAAWHTEVLALLMGWPGRTRAGWWQNFTERVKNIGTPRKAMGEYVF